jgi:hypothetical protein
VNAVLRVAAATGAAVLAPVLAISGWALASAAVVEPALVGRMVSDPAMLHFILPAMVLVTFAHVLLLGLPAVYALVRWRRARVLSVALAGALLAILPIGSLTYPGLFASPGSGYSANGVDLIVDGVPTDAAWWQWLRSLAGLAGLGAIGGAAYWWVWSRQRRDESTRPA